MIYWHCHNNSVNTGSSLPNISDVMTRKRRNVIGSDMIPNNRIETKLYYMNSFLQIFHFLCEPEIQSGHHCTTLNQWNINKTLFLSETTNLSKLKLCMSNELKVFFSQRLQAWIHPNNAWIISWVNDTGLVSLLLFLFSGTSTSYLIWYSSCY